MLSRLGADARRQVGRAIMTGLFNTASRIGRLHPRAQPARHAVEHLRDIRYRDSHLVEHLLDVYRPTGVTPPDFRRYHGPPWPIVFYIHGGAFRILSKDTHWVMGLGFARRGFLVFNISYRLAPQHRYPAAVEDVCEAFTWAMANAERYGGDRSRVVIAGESAGANLATSLAIALAYQRGEPYARAAFDTGVVPRAVLPACGVFQVSDMDRLKRRKPRMSAFVADRLREVEDGYLPRSPHDHSLDLVDVAGFFERKEAPARSIPPFFLPVGTRDPLLPDTRRLAEALRAMNVVAEDVYYPGELHAFHALVMRETARRCWSDTFAFLDRYVPGEPG